MEQEAPSTVAEVMQDTNASRLNDLTVDDSADGSPSRSSFGEVKTDATIESATAEPLEPDLLPSDAVAEPTLADFGEPLRDFEIDNLKYALTDVDGGVDVLIALENNGGVVTDEVVTMARGAGVSQKQIDGYISQQMNVANKAFNDAGLSFTQGRNMMQRVQREFSPRELDIFNRETNENPTQSLKTLKAYFDNEDRR